MGLFSSKKVTGLESKVVEVCGYKDDTGVFHDTKEGALKANLKRHLLTEIAAMAYRTDRYGNTTASYHDAVDYILNRYDLVEKGSILECESCSL